MFFFYEIRDHHHKIIDLQDQTCPVCKNRGTMKMHFMQNYAFFFGPMMPYAKHAVLECESCQTTIPNKKWTKELEVIYKDEKAKLKTPLRLWRGTIVIVSVFLGLFLLMQSGIKNPLGMKDDQQTEAESKARFAAIQVNDVMMVAFLNGGDAGLVKVISVDGNKIGVKISATKYPSWLDGFDLSLSKVNDADFGDEIRYFDAAEFKKNNILIDPENDNKAFAAAKLIIK